MAYVRPGTIPARSDTALVTTVSYDAAGRVQDVTDPRGIISRTLSDALGRTTASISNFTGGAPGSQTDVTTRFTFDSAGRLASRTAVQVSGTPSQTTGYVYGVSPATGSTRDSGVGRHGRGGAGRPRAVERPIRAAGRRGEGRLQGVRD
ncbi:hypothetical protein LBMAG47_30970 [Planctomycetia bacterium]|nr:hypothetical protein LBMAG47_30970 [Planctomycetia bacterium]